MNARASAIPRRAACALLMGAAVLVGACESPPRSTRLTIDDFQQMADAMARSLTRSEALARRGPDSAPWIVSMTRLRNLSSDVMTEAEQWAIMTDLRDTTPLQQLWHRKQVRFVLPPERARALRDSDAFADSATRPGRRAPTHTLTATLRSVTRATAEARTDLYACEFELLALATGEPVWQDRFEIKRAALGHAWD